MLIRSPFDGELLGEVDAATQSDVHAAVSSARESLRSRQLAQWQRAEILDRAAESLSSPPTHELFARTIAGEAAKPIRLARAEVDRAISTFRFSASEARSLCGEVVPLDATPGGAGRIGFTLRLPIGVVGAIAPFNFPLNLVAHKVGPAIAAGCPVVLKPADQTPLTSLALANLLTQCGLPAGYLQVVSGDGPTVGGAIVDHPDVSLITFTGSPEVGWSIRARAPRKRVNLELGNNSPVIVHRDADWESAAARIQAGGFSYAGQACISTQRVYVHQSIHDEFVEALVGEVETLVIGHPLDERTDLSALISSQATERVSSWIDEAVAGGARIATGGGRNEDGVLRPTVLVDVTSEMSVCAREVFGPVVAVAAYGDLDEAFALANNSRYGLQAAIFSSNVAVALRAIRVLDYGGVLVNEVPTWRADHQPYGGVRDSGNTREGPAYSVREMTETRMVVLAP